MSLIPNSVHGLLQRIAAVCLLTLGMIFVCFSTAAFWELQLLTATNRYAALGIAILIAIGCSAFIAFNHKLRNFINNRS